MVSTTPCQQFWIPLCYSLIQLKCSIPPFQVSFLKFSSSAHLRGWGWEWRWLPALKVHAKKQGWSMFNQSQPKRHKTILITCLSNFSASSAAIGWAGISGSPFTPLISGRYTHSEMNYFPLKIFISLIR